MSAQAADIALMRADAISAAPASIDIEQLVRWALMPGRTGGLVWRDEAALSFDRGVTAKTRRSARGSWALIIAGAGVVRRAPRRVVLDAIPDGDAAVVLAAIRALPGAAASLVIHHGRRGTRPGWADRVESLGPHWQAPGRPLIRCCDGRNRERPYCVLKVTVEEVVTPASICRYRLWWDAMGGLGATLDGRLDRWRVRGFGVPERPWEDKA